MPNDIQLTYTNATVIHSNKYNQNNGFYVWHLFSQNLLHDVVFKLETTGEEFPVTLKNMNLPLYQNQLVSLIAVDDTVIGFIDSNSRKYYYLTNNLQKALGKAGYLPWIFWGSIALILGIFYFLDPGYTQNLRALFLIPPLVWLYQMMSNHRFEKKIDNMILQR